MTILAEKDWILEKLVATVNGTEKSVPITVLVEGVSISGELVSNHKFLEHCRTSLAPQLEEGDKVDDVKNYFLTSVLQYSYENILEDKKRLESATFIHLANAKFHSGHNRDISGSNGIFWRGMIEKVSGFYLN